MKNEKQTICAECKHHRYLLAQALHECTKNAEKDVVTGSIIGHTTEKCRVKNNGNCKDFSPILTPRPNNDLAD